MKITQFCLKISRQASAYKKCYHCKYWKEDAAKIYTSSKEPENMAENNKLLIFS